MHSKWLFSLTAATGAVVLPLHQVFAAEEGDVEEVVVTAQKREQRLIDVPMSVTAIGGEEIANRGIQGVQDLSFAVPGVVLRYDGPGSLQVFMRGVGNLAGNDALVSMYMDEVPVTLSGAFRQLDLRALDIERIETLKGPQGTLYGQGSVAGTVRFVTHKPNLSEFEGNLQTEISLIDQGSVNPKVSGVVNIPLAKDALALRVATAVENGGGWIDQPEAGIQDGNNQDLYNTRATLLWKPSDVFQLTGTFAAYGNKSRFGLDYEQDDRTNNVGGGDAARELRPRNDRYTLSNVTGVVDFGPVSLTSSSSYINLKRDYSLTYIAGPETIYGVQNEGFDINDDRSRQFTQELRLSSNGSGPFRYTLGGFYRDSSSDFYDVGLNVYAGTGYPYVYIANDSSRSLSFFADGSYALTERLEVGAGVRSFRDKAELFDGTSTQQDTFKSTDPRVYLSYALSDNWKVYGNVAKGFRSGGFNRLGLPSYGPEKVISYELGTKGSSPGRALAYDIAVYYSDYSDMLRRGLFFVPGAGGSGFVNLTSNIGKVDIKGIEGSVAWHVTEALTLGGSASYVHSEIKKLDLGPGETSAVRAGDRGDYVPKYSFTAAADYQFAWSSAVSGFAHVDFNYRDKVYYTDDFLYLPQFRTQSSQSAGLLNGRLGAQWERFTAALFATNITNENRILDPFAAWSQANHTKPRTVGVQFGVDF